MTQKGVKSRGLNMAKPAKEDNILNIKVEAEFQEYNWDNIKKFLDYLAKNPLTVVFTVTFKDAIEV